MLKLLSSFALALAAVSAALADFPQEFVPGELLVKFKAPSASPEVTKVLKQVGAEVIDELSEIGVSHLRIPETVSVRDAVSYFSKLPNVEFAEPNGIWRAQFVPNDPSWSQQWGPQIINCMQAWDINQGDPNVIIAIVDTGINAGHADLSGKIVPGYDFVNNDADPHDDNGHGTHCAGIAAAKTNNAVGIAGVGFNCSLMGVKVLGSGGSGTWANVAAGINFANNNGAHVISMSLGGGGGSATVETAVNNAWANNRLVVAAAGNNNSTSPSYPAFYSNCIAVGSTTNTDARSSFSNYGASWVDVAAPGTDIYSTYGSGYTSLSGTSMACPHVAGLGGLLWAKNGLNTPVGTIRQLIENFCDPVGNWVAHGRINAFRSLGGVIIPPELDSLTLNTSSLIGGQSTSGTVTLTQPAQSGGFVVTLSSNNSAAQVANVTVPAGQTSANFPVTTSSVVSPQVCTITGSAGGQNRSANLTVNPVPPPGLRDFRLSAYSVLGGSGLYGYIYLDAPAPAGGATVSISQTGGGTSVIVPLSAVVPAGTNFQRFNIRTREVSQQVIATIRITYSGQTLTRQLTINP